VQNFVKLDGLFYAGSHGFDISGPTPSDETSQERDDGSNHANSNTSNTSASRDVISGISVGDSFRPLLKSVRDELIAAVKLIPGL
jgi:hypothetical protein